MFARHTSKTISGFFRRLKSDCSGNVLMIFGFAVIPLTFVAGFGIDYGRAMRLQTHLNAAADAAALAAVSPTMMFESNDASKAAANKMFNSQAAEMSGHRGLVYDTEIDNITTGSGSTLGFLRKATVTYTVESVNFFGGILGADTLTVSGSAAASAAQPPNVDFYLAMDNSPSMLLPATSDGISKVIAATKNEHNANGCAYACHAQIPHSDRIWIEDTAGRDVLLSTSYYNAGSSKKGWWYRWDANSNPKQLYDNNGNPMNEGPTISSGTEREIKQGSYTCGWFWKQCYYDIYVDTTAVKTTTVHYSLVDSTSGPVEIRRNVTTKIDASQLITNTYTGVTTPGETFIGKPTTTSSIYDYGYWADGFWLTHNYGKIYGSPARIPLRKDAMVSAATQLIPFAANQAANYHVTYRMQMFSFDWTRPGKSTPVRQLTGLTDISSYNNGFSVETVFPADDYWYKNSMPTSSLNVGDRTTEMLNMLNYMNSNIPNAGNGAPGNTPQKILFLITDGMLDQPDGGRVMGPMRDDANKELAKCSALKARGIKIAILYTQYLPESLVGDGWSQTNVAPWLPPPPAPYPAGNAGSSDKILTALEKCASPGNNGAPLVQTVTSDDDIGAALRTLFSTTLQTARLIK
ncbi:TadE/TadG family type IV pilus assembly protein [Aurantiacibacter suaedae]|uniref:TadE/TadG family type IV pilus assembly protein n=1 Tax=Aurantiacibacter suaedae TaxID=2545755 RepID=UPI0010F8177E|nr:pilus assembly protein TadG-related protein [Aurantiacibacter suaedae]